MRFTPTDIEGVVIVDLEPIADDRGWFARSYCRDEFLAAGLDPTVAQCNISVTHLAGTIRGMHYQVGADAETKLVRCVRGAIHDVVVDLRPESPTLLQHVAVELRSDVPRALYIAVGCAHGFQTLVDDTEVEYSMGASYSKAAGRGVRFDDPALGVRWPIPVTVVSDQDAAWPDIGSRRRTLLD
jgi:dTDP-4-dehydrorhamnose 3,5-epimerase